MLRRTVIGGKYLLQGTQVFVNTRNSGVQLISSALRATRAANKRTVLKTAPTMVNSLRSNRTKSLESQRKYSVISPGDGLILFTKQDG